LVGVDKPKADKRAGRLVNGGRAKAREEGKTKADRRYLEVGGHGSGKEVIMYSQLEKAVCRTK
jgi:hypothetical protein